MKNMDRLSAQGKVLAAAAIAFLTLSIVSPAKADNIRWQTIVGIIQPANLVGNITGTGAPDDTWWSRSRRSGQGSLGFRRAGISAGGRNSIGTPGAITMVTGTLICGAGTANLTFDTPPVPLSPQGDADFSGTIGPIPTTYSATNVAFLIRIAGGANAGRWIANGAVRTSPGNN